MRIYLNAGFGSPIGADDLAMIGSLRYSGVRQDVPAPSSVAKLVSDLAGSGLRPLWLVPLNLETWETIKALIYESTRAWTPFEYAIEIGNELNLGSWEPDDYSREFADLETLARNVEPNIQLVTAGISTTSRSGLRWLQRALADVSPQAIVGYHTYRKDSYPSPYEPQQGFKARAEEFDELRRIAGQRKLWMTEIGWHGATRSTGCWFWRKEFKLSNAQILDYLTTEMHLCSLVGSEVFVVYQLNDGLGNSDQDHYGIRTAEGLLKPQAHVAEIWRA